MASQSSGLNSASRTLLEIEHLDIVLNACQGCSIFWERLGLYLGLHHNLLQQIARDKKDQCMEQLSLMLSQWLKRNYKVSDEHPEPSQHSLCIAVAKIDISCAETISSDPSFREINNTLGFDNSRPPYTREELIQFCTCTHCDLETIITRGCPQRREDFHPLDIKRLSEKQRQVYFGHAIEEIRGMKDKWSETYDKINQSISRNDEITVSRLKTIMKTLDWFGETKHKKSRLQQLNNCQDKESTFEVYAEICSWLNHHPLEKIVDKCGTENDKQEYENYVAKTKQFLLHSITFFTDSINQDLGGAVTEEKKFCLKLDTDRRLDGTILLYLQTKVAKLLDISQMNLNILSLREGCFEVVFSIPEVTYENHFPLTLDRSRALENLTHEPVGLKFKSIYYSDTWSIKSDEQDIPFTDTKGETNRNSTKSDDTLCTPDISNGANKHQSVPDDDNDEDDLLPNTGTYTELDPIVPQPGRRRHSISVRQTMNKKLLVLQSPHQSEEKQ